MSAPLVPRGTLRSRFVPTSAADIFRRIGVGARTCDLGDEGLYLAEELVAADPWLGEADAQALAILVLALMIAQRQGSTRLPLDASPKGPLRTLVADIHRVAKLDLDVPRVMKTIIDLTRTGRFTNVIGTRDARLPLVVDDDALYTERTRWLEQRVATRLAERIRIPLVDASPIVADLDRDPTRHPAHDPTHPPRRAALTGEQRAAVALALGSKLTIVTGGPGTGKTVVAAAIVRGFARMGIHNVALAAQTGKAANRLTQVIREQLATVAPATATSPAASASAPAASASTAPSSAVSAPSSSTATAVSGSASAAAASASTAGPSSPAATTAGTSSSAGASPLSLWSATTAAPVRASSPAASASSPSSADSAPSSSAMAAASVSASAPAASASSPSSADSAPSSSAARATSASASAPAASATSPAASVAPPAASPSSPSTSAPSSSAARAASASVSAPAASASVPSSAGGSPLSLWSPSASASAPAASASSPSSADSAPSSSAARAASALASAPAASASSPAASVFPPAASASSPSTSAPSSSAAVTASSDADDALAVAPPVAQTLHRLLGYRGGRFAHHAQSPLPVGAVIVDEASMIDLELIDALLDALPPSAPLVLIGDAHQLPAIDAGQLLADLAGSEAIAERTYHQPDLFAAKSPTPDPGTTASPDPSATSSADPSVTRVAVLAKSFRMNTSDIDGRAVYDTAQAVHEGAVHRLTDRSNPLATPRTPGTLVFRGVEWVETPTLAMTAPAAPAPTPAPAPASHAATGAATARAATSHGATARAASARAATARTTSGHAAASTNPHSPLDVTLAVATAFWHHFDGPRALRAAEHVFRFVDGQIDPAQAHELEQLWQLIGRGRILTVTRALATGSIAINDHVHELALDRLSVTGRPDFVPGEPVMITANDYHRGLFNGDQGVIVRADEGLGRHHYRAVFRVAGGELRPFAIEALRDRLELAWALTVHKSQGSELDAIALVLPHEDLPLVTRELIYTGITRARSGVVLCGSRAILTSGAKRRALRHSGLAARLRATLSVP